MAGSRRQWGWHQLSPEGAASLVAHARLPDRSLVVDVGAGLGVVTAALLDAGHRVIAVEAHPARAAALRARFGRRVVVVRADAADLFLPRRPFHVVANPPFGITSALLRRLLHRGSRLTSATLVLQREAALRWADPRAAPVTWHRDHVVQLGPSMSRRSFEPPPKVAVCMLWIDRRETRPHGRRHVGERLDHRI